MRETFTFSFSVSVPFALAIGIAFAAAGCGDTGRSAVEYPMFVRGGGRSTTAGAYQVTLDVAEVAIGPIYFCATSAASASLCPTAENEFAAVAAFDALASDAVELGMVLGVTSTLRSATYDFGVNWFTRQTAPTPAPEAPRGHSAYFEGSATKDGATVRFVADVDITPQLQGTRAVQGARVDATIEDSNTVLDVSVDAAAWWSAVDFDELVAIGGDPIIVPATSRSYSAIVAKMTTGFAPTFTWRKP